MRIPEIRKHWSHHQQKESIENTLESFLCRFCLHEQIQSPAKHLRWSVLRKKTLLTCFVKRSILNVRLDSEYSSTDTYSKDFSTSWLNPLCANPTKQSNTLKQKPTNCLSVFDHFLGLVLKGLIFFHEKIYKLSLIQKHVQNPVKCLRWSKYLVADKNT